MTEIVCDFQSKCKYPSKDDEEKVITRSSQEQKVKYNCNESKAMEIWIFFNTALDRFGPACQRNANRLPLNSKSISALFALIDVLLRMSLLPFLSEVIKIKRTVRTGWKRKNVPEPESVSDHMYFMALMALVATPEHLNKDKCIKIAIVHDLAECITGDITPHDGISPG